MRSQLVIIPIFMQRNKRKDIIRKVKTLQKKANAKSERSCQDNVVSNLLTCPRYVFQQSRQITLRSKVYELSRASYLFSLFLSLHIKKISNCISFTYKNCKERSTVSAVTLLVMAIWLLLNRNVTNIIKSVAKRMNTERVTRFWQL